MLKVEMWHFENRGINLFQKILNSTLKTFTYISLGLSFANFVPPDLKLHNQYCHNERDRSCDELNSLNLEREAPRSRILTGES